MTNEEYVATFRGDTPETSAKVLAVLNKYGENRWWLSNDLRIIGYWQLNEDCLVVPFAKFHEGISQLLCRPVWTHELGLNVNGLRQEAANAILGVERSEEDRQEAIRQGIDTLYDFAREHGKQVLEIEVNPDA